MLHIAEESELDFCPFAMTNYDLTKLVKPYQLWNGDDIDLITTEGVYYWESERPSHIPADSWGKMIILADKTSGCTPLQIILYTNNIYVRRYGGNPVSWSSWVRFSGTVVQ